MILSDAELKIMMILWDCEEDLSVARIYDLVEAQTGWHKNTVYTIIKKCIQKGVIQRYEPFYMCRALIARGEFQKEQIQQLIDKYFHGSYEYFYITFIKLSQINIFMEAN